jgi:hypothetical protein
MSATPSLFRLLRVAPAVGRVFTDSEGEIGAEQNVILSFAPTTTIFVRTAIAGVDPTLALFDVKTMEERKDFSLSSRRTSMSLALAFGGLALFLSAIGIYSVLSYLLGQRRREIGIRLAVGSTPAGIFNLVLREGLLLTGSGLLLGFAGAAALQKAVENQIYGVRPLDPLVIGIVQRSSAEWRSQPACVPRSKRPSLIPSPF